MLKAKSIEISGFWGSKNAKSDFREDVNIIIGRNGTGKTTFMNILNAVLSVDIDALSENIFASVRIVLSDGRITRTIRAERQDSDKSLYPHVTYYLSNRRHIIPLIGIDEARNATISMRRRANEEAQKLRTDLGTLVSVASLSVYRMSGDVDPEFRDRTSRKPTSPVDVRLGSLMQRLTQYQLELSVRARETSTELQKDVLASLLYTGEKSQNEGYDLDFDENVERHNLIGAYKQLGVSGTEITKKIGEHIAATVKARKDLRGFIDDRSNSKFPVDIAALDAFKLTRVVVEKSLLAEAKIEEIFNQANRFLSILKTFIPDKSFSFSAGVLHVSNEGPIPLAKLSSGEKQLLILFIEALLQREQPFIFLADEPELSLHISWQRSIIGTIRSLNPNAQIIVATHSPEIAGKFKACILDMEDILHD